MSCGKVAPRLSQHWKSVVKIQMVTLVIDVLRQPKNNSSAEVCLPCLLSGPFVHFTVVCDPIRRTAAPHLEATFGRFHGHILFHCVSALETYHGLVNGLLSWRIVDCSPSLAKAVNHGSDLVETVMSWLVARHCL